MLHLPNEDQIHISSKKEIQFATTLIPLFASKQVSHLMFNQNQKYDT